MQDEPARWLTIVSNDDGNDCLSKLLGFSYKKKYLPFMLQCRLIKENKSKKWKTIHIKPCIDIMGNYSSYSWSDFIAEYKLNIETSYICIEGAKVYFICIGSFACATKPFTVLDQIRGGMKFK
jgi:hypothetical protein